MAIEQLDTSSNLQARWEAYASPFLKSDEEVWTVYEIAHRLEKVSKH